MNRSTDEEDGEEENPKVDENVRPLYADDLPEEIDGKHAIDPKHSKEQGKWHPSQKNTAKGTTIIMNFLIRKLV